MSRKRPSHRAPTKAEREARRKDMDETLARLRSQAEVLEPGQVAFSTKAAPSLTFFQTVQLISMALAFLAVLVGIVRGGFWLLGRGFDAEEHRELVHRTLPPRPEYPAKYAAFTATDAHGTHQICVFAYENLHIIRVDNIKSIPDAVRRFAIYPETGGPLFKHYLGDMTVSSPVIIKGTSIDITTGPLIERHAMVASLRNSYKGLSDASIRFAYADTRGPPHGVADQSLVYLSEEGNIAGPPARLIIVVGDIPNVKFPEVRDRSRLDLIIRDSAGPSRENEDSFFLDLEVAKAEFSRYYTEVYEWNRVAQAHGVEILPIDPFYVSRDIRKAIGEETEADREQEMREQFERSAERETRARERGVP